jgi:hypothetical protein
MRRIWGLAVAAVAMLALGQAGVLSTLGAHPFWSELTAPALGVIVGAFGYGLGLWRYRQGLVAMSAVLGMSIAAAHFGKRVFVASYADNALAGDFWFFGWIFLCGALIALTGLLLDRGVFRARQA